MIQGNTLNLRHLRAFLAVVDAGSVTGASGVVHLSQPAITQAIAKLEGHLGCPLFSRSGRGMVPTEFAETLHMRVARAIRYLASGGKIAARVAKATHVMALENITTSTQLRALIAIGEFGSFLGAARHLGTAQPSVFRAARELEKLAGFELYTKRPKGIELTLPATHLYRAAKLAFSELDQGLEEIQAIGGVDTGRLYIGALPLLRSKFLPDAIDRFLKDFPDARIRVIDGLYSDLMSSLRVGNLDVVVGALRDPDPFEDVQQVKLLDDRLGVYCHPNHPALQQKPSGLMLTRAKWVVSRSGTPTRDQFDAFWESLGAKGPPNLIETGSLIMMRGLLGSCERLAVVSKTQAEDEVQLGTMAELPIDLKDQPRPIGYTVRRDWHPTDLQARFLELLDGAAE